MSTTYAQKQAPAQKKDAPTAASILDASSQSEGLQRKADMANNVIQCYKMSLGFAKNHGNTSLNDEGMINLLKTRNKQNKDIKKNSVLKSNATSVLESYSSKSAGPISIVPCKTAKITGDTIIINQDDECKVWINDKNEMGHIGKDKPKKEAANYTKIRKEKKFSDVIRILEKNRKDYKASRTPDAEGFTLIRK